MEPLGGFRIVHEVLEGDEGTTEFCFHRRSRLQGGTVVTVSAQLCVHIPEVCPVISSGGRNISRPIAACAGGKCSFAR